MGKKELSLGKAEWYIGQWSEKCRIWFYQDKSRSPEAGSCSGGHASALGTQESTFTRWHWFCGCDNSLLLWFLSYITNHRMYIISWHIFFYWNRGSGKSVEYDEYEIEKKKKVETEVAKALKEERKRIEKLKNLLKQELITQEEFEKSMFKEN